jgi:primosomal protein N' (replication factor Y)
MYAEIVVNAPLSRRRVPYLDRTEGFAALGQTFTYSIPAHLAGRVQPGQLVTVPFGARKLQGIILELAAQSKIERIKDVYDIVDSLPVLSAPQIALAHWLSAYYFAPLIDCVLQMFPPGLESEVQTTIALNPDARPVVNPKDAQAYILARLRKDGPLALAELTRGDRKQDLHKEVEKLVRSNVLLRATRLLPPAAKEKRERTIELIAEPTPELRGKIRSRRQLAVLDFMLKRGGVGSSASWHEAAAASKADAATFRALSEAGLIRIDQRIVWRDPLKGFTFDRSEPPALTPEQQSVWDVIHGANSRSAEHPAPFLLFGVTGSGKTEIYLRAVAAMLLQRRQAIVLVPEIALTPQTIRRFAERLPSPPAVIHSQLSLGERYDQWRRIRAGEIDVVIGSRSAVFAPLPRLGLLILDEEHEPSYKQDDHVRYHAREVALEYARLVNATVILASATPSLESMWHAIHGDYRLLEMKQRIANTDIPDLPSQDVRHAPLQSSASAAPRRVLNDGGPMQLTAEYFVGAVPPRTEAFVVADHAPVPYRRSGLSRPRSGALPETAKGDGLPATEGRGPAASPNIQLPPVEIVDMREELKAGNTSILSRALRDALSAALAAHEQAILFLNRRGSATFVMCRDCGFVMRCRRCDSPLVFHADQAELVCHRCNQRYAQPVRCPNCSSIRIRQFGTGTQKVEEVIRQMFPTARPLRWDRDVTGAKGAHDAILRKFVSRAADILIGTQMVAKGHDLPHVTLVGVISADTMLNLPDFRASERTFQILAQVAGRAGRSRLLGRAIFQTYAPTHPAIVAAAQHDYEQFYRSEIEFRRQLDYPPFTRLIRLVHTGTNADRVQLAATSLHRSLEQRIRQRALTDAALVGPAPCFIHKLRGSYRWQIIVKGHRPEDVLRDVVLPLGWRVDVDPMSVL